MNAWALRAMADEELVRPETARRPGRSRLLAGLSLSACLHAVLAACLLAALLGPGAGLTPGGGGIGRGGGSGSTAMVGEGGNSQSPACLVHLELYRVCPSEAEPEHPEPLAEREPVAEPETAVVLADREKPTRPAPARPRTARPAAGKAWRPAALTAPAEPAKSAEPSDLGISGGAPGEIKAEAQVGDGKSPGDPIQGGGSGQGTGAGGGAGSGRGAERGPGTGDGAYALADVDQHPRLVSRVEPHYPESARKMALCGKIMAHFLVDEQGKVHAPSVASASPPGVFEDSVIEAVSRWRFEPARLRGRPVKVWATAPVRFEINAQP